MCLLTALLAVLSILRLQCHTTSCFLMEILCTAVAETSADNSEGKLNVILKPSDTHQPYVRGLSDNGLSAVCKALQGLCLSCVLHRP